MSSSKELLGEYINPGLSPIEREALGTICVMGSSYDAGDSPEDRMRVLTSGFVDGLPGYMRQWMMDPEVLAAFAQKSAARDAEVSSPQATDRRQVTAYSFVPGNIETVGLAVYDSSVPWGSPETVRPAGDLARMTTCVVVGSNLRGERFTQQQILTIGVALGYGALLDMQARGFERVRYEFVGLAVDPESDLQRNGTPIIEEQGDYLVNYSWLF